MSQADSPPPSAREQQLQEPGSPGSPGLNRGRTPEGIGGSIRRKLREVKDTQMARAHRFARRASSASSSRSSRSRESLSDYQLVPDINGPTELWTDKARRQHRSQSEVHSSRPIVNHSNTEPMRSLSPHDRRRPSLGASSVTVQLSASPPNEGPQAGPAPDAAAPQDEEATPVAQDSSMLDVTVPQLLQLGVPMLKVSAKKQKRYIFKLDPDQGQIVWQSKKLRIIPIENIKELREGADARYYRQQFQIAPSFEDRWLTIVYVLDGRYKTLHLLAATRDVFQMWDLMLRRLYAIRQKLMSGLGYTEVRQAVWEKQFWKGDSGTDQRLEFEEVERMCRRLNINPSTDDLLRRFKEADAQGRGYLDFSDFQRFVKALKARPEIDSLYERIAGGFGGTIAYEAFEQFMRTCQKSSLSATELQRIFLRYASSPEGRGFSPPSSPARNTLELAAQSTSVIREVDPSRGHTDPTGGSPRPPSSIGTPSSSILTSNSAQGLTIETAVMSLKGFTTFLLSTDNSAFADQHGKIYHDMTHSLPDYYVSSSHNTYLVGHQLVGESTIEGYIRALLHSCRSVELDIYDGDVEPVVYHKHTLVSKVSLRDACAAINKYAFVASPYPIIISAEVHCSLPQQDLIAKIMQEEFGDALMSAPVDGRPRLEALPSPEDLKGCILLKAKNLFVTDKSSLQEKEIVVDAETSSTETSSASELEELKEWRNTYRKDLKSELKKARAVLGGSPRADARQLPPTYQPPQKVRMSLSLVALLVYTVGVKCRGLNKKEVYAPEHLFSLSEGTSNRLMKQGMLDLIKHNRTHLVRIYPKGTRIGSTNFEPHRFWSAGCQLVAINWQTFDLGYMINRAMFQRNGRAGYVLKPLALRLEGDKQLLRRHNNHCLEVIIISAQQLPRPKDSSGRDVTDRSTVDPFVEVSLHIPDWPEVPPSRRASLDAAPVSAKDQPSPTKPARTVVQRTGVVKNNGFNPVWEQQLSIPFDVVGEMHDLVFVRFAVKQEGLVDEEPLAVYCASLGSLNMGYRHLPLHDAQLSQYLFSTLFVKLDILDM
ncbi:PLC-like phosphodiesterase [Daedalea quercina L-15889]|uniref:Phosphoinositide phospholipase C n=1 Tax=Daedalea quercina L-15889 TaxID=1314783 RepID=A0A165LCI0_9APHY|nr:PLC-like phosphodiesterase [Daedalea quercina L-15889]